MVAMKRAAAIVTDHGSVTGHMASLSREFGVPTLLGLDGATRRLVQGEAVTVDAASCRIYRGRVEGLLAETADKAETAFMAGTQVHAILAAVASRIVPLTMLDPRAKSFGPAGCTSLHDVTRLLHEWSYGEMFAVSDLAAGQSGGTVTLAASTGLDLHIIDLGGGIKDEAADKSRVAPEDIASRPFAALLTGLVLTARTGPCVRSTSGGSCRSCPSRSCPAQTRRGPLRRKILRHHLRQVPQLQFPGRLPLRRARLLLRGHASTRITSPFPLPAARPTTSSAPDAPGPSAASWPNSASPWTRPPTGWPAGSRNSPPTSSRKNSAHMGRLLQFTRQTDMLMVSEASIEAMVACFLSGARPASTRPRPVRRREDA
jgi:pyruvate,water dikinase